MITIIDYGLGNIRAFVNLYAQLNIPVTIATNKDQLSNATKVILPGVGSFDKAMTMLEGSGMRPTLDGIACNGRVPILGVCVGMQMLASSSEEGVLPGLGWIPGEVVRFSHPVSDSVMQVPHMGWNNVTPVGNDPIFKDLDDDASFYFLHSYYFKSDKRENVIAVTNYGCEFTSAVSSGNIYGVQFHPEKSHHYGARLLKNFAEL